jgi:hypothetical protein
VNSWCSLRLYIPTIVSDYDVLDLVLESTFRAEWTIAVKFSISISNEYNMRRLERGLFY